MSLPTPGWEEIASSKRSDSGERCEVKKAMKTRGRLGREVRSEWAEETIENKSYRRSLSHLSSSLAFIFSRSLLRTTPHYLNACNRLGKKKCVVSVVSVCEILLRYLRSVP